MTSRILQFFLWLCVVGWGVGLGAKLFDLVVVAGAWSATPPGSFALLPYGRRYPVDPGDFFIPPSAVMAVGVVGSLISGWRTPVQLRRWLWMGLALFLVIWAITPAVFWPMIAELYCTATGRIALTDVESIQLARRWLVWDWFRTSLIATGFLGYVRALTLSTRGPA